MRVKKTKDGVTLKAYAGTTGVLLAFNIDEKKTGILGFAIEKKKKNGNWYWLQGLLKFKDEENRDFKGTDTILAPIQKFRWSDYGVYPDTEYSYRLHAVFSVSDESKNIIGPVLKIRTESITRGLHRVIFNRAVAASQAYSRHFGNTSPDDPTDPKHLKAREWLTRGMLSKIQGFMKRAKDDNYMLEFALFEFDYDGLILNVQQAIDRNVDVKLMYHGKPGHKFTIRNEKHLKVLPDQVLYPRNTNGLFHQKFIILHKKNNNGQFKPISVLMGTANFTPNGLWRQANVIHVINSKRIASKYSELYNQLLNSEGYSDTKKFINEEHPINDHNKLSYSFSPRSNFVDIDYLNQTIQNAKSEIFLCSAFKIHDNLSEILLADRPDILTYGLQNSRTKITGIHRGKTFVTAAFLKKGLDKFLRESSAEQRGSIFIHLKCMLIDYTTENPIVVVGSHNFSNAASKRNDENFIIIKGNTDVADTYFCEMMRLYDHYRFRYNRKKYNDGGKRQFHLASDDSWADDYFNPSHTKYMERVKYSN